MNDLIGPPPVRHRSGRLFRVLSSLLTAVCGLTLISALASPIRRQVSLLSPTAAAHSCFYFPEEPALPCRAETVQKLLASSFFGSDALYFDLGDENTGRTELSQPEQSRPSPSIGSDGDSPQNSLTPPRVGDIYTYDYSKLPTGRIALLPYDLSGSPAPGQILLSNTTSLKLDPSDYLKREYPISEKLADEPLVLIVHTHGTEAFSPEGASSAEPGGNQRSTDRSENIVSVGAVMSDLLNDAGIPTLHCEIMHDLESYRDSYELSADTVRRYLAEHPSIKYVFDVHRDAISRQNGDIVKPVCLVDGGAAAQIMLLVGTNEKGADHPNWEDNLTVAVQLQKKLSEHTERLARPINIRGASFNQQFTPGSLLIEIGSSGNTLAEAKLAARALTYSLIELIEENRD